MSKKRKNIEIKQTTEALELEETVAPVPQPTIEEKPEIPVIFRHALTLHDWLVALPRIYLVLSSFLILVLFSLLLILKDLPAPTQLTNLPVPQTTKLLDRNGQLLYNIYVSENRTIVPLSEIPKYLQLATIATEDKDFYKHGGINLIGGVLRAVKDMILYRHLEGGSTITQQLIKTSLLTPEQTVQRKIKEWILAFWTESIYSKDQILALYLNRIPYGGTAYGIEEASQVYFGKHVRELDLAESALLVGLPAAPTYYSPFGTDPSRSVDRQHKVLARMVEDKYIDKNTYDQAIKEELHFSSASAGIKAPHFVAYVREQLVKKYGEQIVEQGGLKVTTTLNLDLQNYSQASLSAEVTKQKELKVGNGAALVVKPATGEILAMIGSRDYFASEGGKFNVTLSQRSPGSTLKPIDYALGFLKGNSNPATAWIDYSFCFPAFAGKSYCPQNYDGKFHGVVQTRFALGNSFNVPATKQLALNTVADFIATASAMGITTLGNTNRYGYSLVLGGGEVKMVDLATAFGTFANRGKTVGLTPILKVEDSTGKILEDNLDKFKDQELKIKTDKLIAWDGLNPWTPHDGYVLPEEVTFLISHILLDDSSRATTFGAGSILNIPGKVVSVKTGTSEQKSDNWTIGYTPSILGVVWVGNNDNTPMSPYLESGNTGAAPIWNKIMTYALKDSKSEWPQKPENVIFQEICALSGLLPDHGCPTRGEYFIKNLIPKEKDNVWDQKRKIWVFKDSHKQPGPNDRPNPDQITEEDHLVISDPLQKDFCVDCAL